MSKYSVKWYTNPDGLTQFQVQPPCEALTNDVLQKLNKRCQGYCSDEDWGEPVRRLMLLSIMAWLDGYEAAKESKS